MGPRSDNRGYAASTPTRGLHASMGPRSDNRGYGAFAPSEVRGAASMGPRSDNRGYAKAQSVDKAEFGLQWVHGPITVVMDRTDRPRSRHADGLQWVHGPITVVMTSPAVTCDMLP